MKTFFVFLLLVSPVYAQTAADCTGAQQGNVSKNPSTVTFGASTDQNTLNSDGTPKLTSYKIGICSGSTLVQSVDLGKPNPDANNLINSPLPTNLPKNVQYYLWAYASGPGGVSRSALPTLPFAWDAPPGPAGNPTTH